MLDWLGSDGAEFDENLTERDCDGFEIVEPRHQVQYAEFTAFIPLTPFL